MVTMELSKENILLLVDVIQAEIFCLEEKHQLNQWNMPPHLMKRVSDLYSLLNTLKILQPHAI
jgi:hypothetical protein